MSSGSSAAAPESSQVPRPQRPFGSDHIAVLERRLEALGDRVERAGLVESGVWGDLCAALLPELYGEPSRLPERPTAALPGSPEKIEELARRYSGPGPVAEESLWHPGDPRGTEARVEAVAGTGAAPLFQQERERALTPAGVKSYHDDRPRTATGQIQPAGPSAGCSTTGGIAGLKGFMTNGLGAYVNSESRLAGRDRGRIRAAIEARERAHEAAPEPASDEPELSLARLDPDEVRKAALTLSG